MGAQRSGAFHATVRSDDDPFAKLARALPYRRPTAWASGLSRAFHATVR
jgi:hypothetical protein